MKNNLDKDFDMDFSWYTQDDLLNQAFDMRELSKMDRGDMVNLIRELAIRLQRADTELHSIGSR